jgi:restriction system protein
MARRKNTSVLEDLFGIAAALPWWAGVALAMVSYVVLHRYAVAEVPTNVASAQIGKMVTGQLIKSLSTYLQYILPLVLLAGSLASFIGRRKRAFLVRDAAQGNTDEAIRNMSWQDFELLVGEVFRLRGFSVAETGSGGADGGVDLKLRKDREFFLVQCKQWRSYKVPVNVVRELYGVMAAQGAAGGFVVTSGVFTADAQSFAKGRDIELIDGQALSAMMKKARGAGARIPRSAVPTIPAATPGHGAPSSRISNPTCLRCGSAMIKRTAKQGPNAGHSFWGCTTYPKCRRVRAAE